jgi:hypothetical protein
VVVVVWVWGGGGGGVGGGGGGGGGGARGRGLLVTTDPCTAVALAVVAALVQRLGAEQPCCKQ